MEGMRAVGELFFVVQGGILCLIAWIRLRGRAVITGMVKICGILL